MKGCADPGGCGVKGCRTCSYNGRDPYEIQQQLRAEWKRSKGFTHADQPPRERDTPPAKGQRKR